MNSLAPSKNSAKRIVLLAAVLVLALAGSLALRMVHSAPYFETRASEPVTPDALRWSGGPPAAGTVPAPRAAGPEDLAPPPWFDTVKNLPIRFQTDLDLIAPLGDGPENAAVWFADFVRPAGARLAEIQAAAERADAATGNSQLLPPDDPLLLEAEAWVDQATMRFYPDVFEPDGWNTQIPNLLMTLSLAKSWTARGDATDDLETALRDYRRAIRLGRLLRQEDATLITDLVGLGCISRGLQAMYERLVAEGEADRALVVALALGEVAPQRLKSSEAITQIDPSRHIRRGWFGVDVRVPDETFDSMVRIAEKHSERRFRLEAILMLNAVHFEGSRSQRAASGELLERLATSDDPWISDLARRALEEPPDLSMYTGL